MNTSDTRRANMQSLLDSALRGKESTVILISCSKSKINQAAPASELYRSAVFRKSLDVARRLGVKHYILSAKYGLISAQCVLPPYDASIKDLSEEERDQWAEDVARVLIRILPQHANVWFFSSRHYSDPITPRIQARGIITRSPLSGLSIGHMSSWLSTIQNVFSRRELAVLLYSALERLAHRQGLRTLRDLIRQGTCPQQGLYIFFDAAETSKFSDQIPRIVRIGTHGVSEGSKSLLRTRLRAHLGAKTGDGNHRGSVFRLHVGAALIQRSGSAAYQEWGKGQQAPRATRDAESALEREVSEYIGSLKVLVVPIFDMAGRTSRRALMERNLIALLTQDGLSLEVPNDGWLGFWSPKQAIRRSGLWNVQHVGEKLDPKVGSKFVQLLDQNADLLV